MFTESQCDAIEILMKDCFCINPEAIVAIEPQNLTTMNDDDEEKV